MAKDDADQAGQPAVSGWPAVTLVLVIVLGLALVIWILVSQLSDTEANTAIAAVVGPLAGVGVAAFGIQARATAKAESQQVKDQAASVANEVAKLADQARSGEGTAMAKPRSGSGTNVIQAEGAAMDAERLRTIERSLRNLAR